MRGPAVWVTCLCVGVLGIAPGAAQDGGPMRLAAGPRFLAPARGAPVADAGRWVDASRMPVLQQRIAVDLRGVPLGAALRAVGQKAGLQVTYSPNLLRADKSVTLGATAITVGAALSALLYDAGVDVLLTAGGHAVIVARGQAPLATGAIVGWITDAKTGGGVTGAEVFLEKTKWRAVTDTAGRYRLADLDPGQYTLMIRRLGYARQSRAVTVREGRTDTVDVALEPVVARMEELVATATGRQRRLDIANDVTVLNADSIIQAAPVRSVTDLLESRVPGLTVQRTSGAPGDPARLRLRGASSPLRSNDPIVVVDGVRVYAEQSASRNQNLARHRNMSGAGVDTPTMVTSSYTSATPSPIDYIDPNSIETIEVLKGPSAATLYGQDAANGVIVITTKKGRAGPPRWTGSVEHGRTHLAGEYPTLFLRWGHKRFNNTPTSCPVTSTECVGDSVLTFQLLNDPALTVLDRGHRTAATFGVSGGSAALTYALTGSYQDEVGLLRLPAYEVDRFQTLFGTAPPSWILRPQNLTRWGVTSTIRAQLGTKAEVALMTSLSRTDQQKSSLQGQLGALMSTFLDRSTGTYYQESQLGGGFSGSSLPGGFQPVTTVFTDYFERATDAATQLTNGLSLVWRPQAWLTLTADAGLNLVHRADELYLPRGVPGVGGSAAHDTIGLINHGQGRSLVSTLSLRGTTLQPLGHGFQVRVAAGANYVGSSSRDLAVGTEALTPGTSLYGSVFTFARPAEQSDATFGWYLEPSVGNTKWNFTTGLRLDGGKSYGANLRGLRLPKFPKLGFSYLLSDEPWFPFRNLVQSFRVRVAYGKASRQPELAAKLRLYTVPGQVYANGAFQTGVELATLGNTEVRPERSTEFEGGFDADLLDSRIRLTISGYRKTTDDALLSVPVAPSVYDGLSLTKNIGVTRNTGLEMDVGADLVRSGPVTWTTQLQLSQRRDLLVELAPGVEPFYPNPAGGHAASGIRVAPGYPLFGRWSLPILGYGDANGDGVLQPDEIQLGDTAVYVGSTIPNYTAAFSTTVSLWRGAVTLNAAFSHDGGVTQRNEVVRTLAPFAAGNMVPDTPLDEQVATSVLTKTDYNLIQTTSTTRFQSLAVRYNLPVALAGRLGAKTLSIAVQGSNLGLWTDYRGLDPNVNAFGTGNDVADTGILPQPRTWQVRVNATY